MINVIYLHKSPRYDKKWMVDVSGKKIHFGAKGYDDYTMHHDDNRKYNYINRHARNEDWRNWRTAGFWSRWLLWNEPSINKSIEYIEDNFPVKILRYDNKSDGGENGVYEERKHEMILRDNDMEYDFKKNYLRSGGEEEEEEMMEVKKKGKIIKSRNRLLRNGKEVYNLIKDTPITTDTGKRSSGKKRRR